MTEIQIDDHTSQVEFEGPKKIADMVSEVVRALPPNRLVTEVSVNGIPVKDTSAAFDGLGQLAIKTVDREIWAATGLDIAISCIERVQKSLIHAAELFRREDKAKANQFFVHCVDGLERFFEAVIITRSVLRLDFEQLHVEGISLAQTERNFSRILENIVIYQERQDFPAIADKVEYELLTNLCGWASALKQLRLSQLSNA